jgi:hypothetical protein
MAPPMSVPTLTPLWVSVVSLMDFTTPYSALVSVVEATDRPVVLLSLAQPVRDMEAENRARKSTDRIFFMLGIS